MKKWIRSILPWLIPALFIALMVGLTIPWTYWVIQAAYDRDVQENAHMLGLRVAIRVLSALPGQTTAQTLNTELLAEAPVQVCIFVDGRGPVTMVPWGRPGRTPPAWATTPAKLKELADKLQKQGGPMQTQDAQNYYFYVPFFIHAQPTGPNPLIGFTYMELSRAALAQEFKTKEGPLVKRVEATSAVAVLVLSALAIIAFWIWQRSSKVRRRAELERLGLRAERGLTAAVLAHEIRNPLAALRFQLHSLRTNASDGARVASTADTIDGELLRIQQLVTDYLEHERARSMRVAPVDLADAAHKLQSLLQELFRQGDTQLSVIAPQAPVIVTCDPHALRQILMNLVLNAQQAIKSRPSRATTAPKPGAIDYFSGARGPGSIVLRIGSADGYGTIDVADNGPGIPPEMRERLFKPFQTTKRDGHGIGLALVKRFVDNYGGSVSVESDIGKGTTFHLRLPLSGEDTEHPPAGGAPEAVGAEVG